LAHERFLLRQATILSNTPNTKKSSPAAFPRSDAGDSKTARFCGHDLIEITGSLNQ
jgi:hypothetical protein